MVSMCTSLLGGGGGGGGRSCEHFGGYKTINQIPLNTYSFVHFGGIPVGSVFSQW